MPGEGAASEAEARAHLKTALDRKPEVTERRRLVLLSLDQADTERDLAQIARAEAALLGGHRAGDSGFPAEAAGPEAPSGTHRRAGATLRTSHDLP